MGQGWLSWFALGESELLAANGFSLRYLSRHVRFGVNGIMKLSSRLDIGSHGIKWLILKMLLYIMQ